MNERDHVLNAMVLGVGMGIVLAPDFDGATARSIFEVGIPVVLGALVPDLDLTFGSHRKTLHNLLTHGAFAAFPILFGNLQYVWIGVLTHYLLDLFGNVRGMAIFYPHPVAYDVPVGVTVDSRWATVVTLVVTAGELTAFYVLTTTAATVSIPTPGGLVPA